MLLAPATLHSQTQPTTPPTQTATAPTANPKTPNEFFARARQLQDLEAAGIPFHLKATYVATGDVEFTGNGTYEIWWQSKDVWRKEATLGNYKFVSVHNGSQAIASATDAYMPLRARQAIAAQPFRFDTLENDKMTWKVSPPSDSATTGTHVTVQHSCAAADSLMCTEDYEFREDGTIRSRRDNDITEIYRDPQLFGKQLIPRQFDVSLRGEKILTCAIPVLEALPLNDPNRFDTKLNAELRVPLNLAIGYVAKFPADGVKPPKARSTPEPKYPKIGRKNRIESTVLVVSAIDISGQVREPYVLLSGGPEFDEAALAAVRRYKFKPATFKGEPVPIDLGVFVAFHLR